MLRVLTQSLFCLCRAGLRTETSIVAETAQSFSTHHTAVLIGYGAHAVCPYLALETCRQWRSTPRYPLLPSWNAHTLPVRLHQATGCGLLFGCMAWLNCRASCTFVCCNGAGKVCWCGLWVHAVTGVTQCALSGTGQSFLWVLIPDSSGMLCTFWRDDKYPTVLTCN